MDFDPPKFPPPNFPPPPPPSSFDNTFILVPIIAGVGFGSIFLIAILCFVCRYCASRNRRQSHFHPAVVGPNTVSGINSQFNQPLPAAAPYHTFASAPYPPSAPTGNYPLDPWHQCPSDQSRPTHHQQNICNGQLSTATSPPMPQSDAPPSYSEVVSSC